jgi:hypothetical protein
MTHHNNKLVVVHMDARKLKREPDTNFRSFSKAKLEKLIEKAVVDAYTEEEQALGLLTMLQEHLALPFSTNVLGIDTRWPDCRDLPPWPNLAEDRCPRSAVADASARRRGMDRGLPLLA